MSAKRAIPKVWDYIIERPLLRSILFGWLLGVLWWTGILIAQGPTVVAKTNASGELVERREPFVRTLGIAAILALPWALVGVFVGALNSQLRGFWIPAATLAG